MSANKPKVAIVILNWNGREFLEQFLPSVMATEWENKEIILADNASTDDSVAWVEANYPPVRIIRLEKNLGFAGGYNAALQQVKADYYVLLNQDVEVSPEWINPMAERMESDPGIAACQPKIRMQRQKDTFEYAGACGGYMDWLGYTFCRGRLFDTVEQDTGQYDKAETVWWTSGAAMMIRAELYHRLDGLDEKFFAHMEEIDLCWRLKRAGYRLMVEPRSVVYHVGGGSLPHGNPHKAFLNFRNSLYMFVKNMPVGRLLWFLPFRLMLDWVAGLKALLSGHAGESGAIVKAHLAFLARPGRCVRMRRTAARQVKESRTGPTNHSGLYRGSLLWDYFVRKKRIFSQLPSGRFIR